MLPMLDVFMPLCLAGALAGIVRGFTGFGSARVFIPIVGGIIEPWHAVILLFLIDGLMSLPLVPNAIRACTWREVVPLSLGAAVTVPLGTHFLVSIDPTVLRWVVSGLALGAVAALASGWRYRSPPSPKISAAVGASSGFLGGLCTFWGPPIVIFWLAGQSTSHTVRANFIVFITAMTLVSGVTFASYGLFQTMVVYQALLLMPVYGLAVWIGAKLFPHASEGFFWWIAYLVSAAAAVFSVPAFDRHLK